MAKQTAATKPKAKKSPRKKLEAPAARRLKPARRGLLHQPQFGRHPIKLPNVWRLSRRSFELVWQYRRLFISITIIYGLLNLVLVQGLASSTDVGSLKSELNKVFTGHFGSVASGLSIFVVLLGSAGNGSSQTAGAYQLFLAIIASLAIIWGLRQVMTGSLPRLRDCFYRGMYPLVPYLLILILIGLQLLPLLIGAAVYNTVLSNAIAVGWAEKLFWLVLFIALGLWSLYMLSASLMATYIVTLPDMTPRQALRSARGLVKYRRWTVLRKILFLPVMLLIVAAVIMLPIIIWLSAVAQWIFFILTMFALLATHAYLYTLYRELLNE